MTQLHPLLDQKVVNIQDIRAQRMAALDVDRIIEEQESGRVGEGMTNTEKVFWRNLQFFAERLARGGGYGRVAYAVGHIDGVQALCFECEAYTAYYWLSEQLVLDFSVDPLLTRWSHRSEPPFPVVGGVVFIPEEN